MAYTKKQSKKPGKGTTTTVTGLSGKGAVLEYYAKPEKVVGKPPACIRNRVSSLGSLRGRVETKKRLGEAKKGVDKTKERLEFRERLDIFETPKCQEWYVRSVKESLETFEMGDKLHKFIVDHNIYNIGEYTRWNSEFAKMINISPPDDFKGNTPAITESRIAMAAQQVMADYFNCDVFKLTSDNGWDEEDGKVGPYTTGVVTREYWRSVWGKTSKKKPNPPKASKLGFSYDQTNVQLLASAVAGFAALIATSTPDTVTFGKKTRPEEALARKVKTRRKEVAKKMTKREKERRRKEKMRRDYERRDTKKSALKLKNLVKRHKIKGSYKFLTKPIAEIYGEKTKGWKLENLTKTFRVLNLLVKAGVDVDMGGEKIKIRKGDTVEVTPDGFFKVTRSNGVLRYKVKIS